MQLGMIGLGKMGKNMRDRLRRAGHEVIGYDLDEGLTDVATIDFAPVATFAVVAAASTAAASATATIANAVASAAIVLKLGG